MAKKLYKTIWHFILGCILCFNIISCYSQENPSSKKEIESSPRFEEEKSSNSANSQTKNLSQERQNTVCDFSEFNTLKQKPASIVRMVKPAYPLKARRKKISGEVIVRVLINKSGIVEKACAVKGNRLLKDSAVKAALLWKYSSPVREIEKAGHDYLEYDIAFNFYP